MFGFKIIRESKEEKKEAKIYSISVTDIYNLPGDIMNNLSSSFALGDMVYTHTIGEQIKRLSSYIEIYHFNKFSYTSTYMSLKEFEKHLIDTYMNMMKVQSQMKTLQLNIMEYQQNLKAGFIEYDPLRESAMKRDAEIIQSDCNASMNVLISQMKTFLIAIQSAIVDERERVVTGVDIISDFKKRKDYMEKGNKITVSFMMKDKKSVLGKTTENKE